MESRKLKILPKAQTLIFSPAAAFFLSAVAFLWADEEGPQAAEPKEIRFVCYNLKNYLRQDRIVKGELIREVPKPEEEKRAIVATFAKLRPEIIGMCEMGDARDVADLRERLKLVGLEYPHLEWISASDEVRHLALLSQFPIVSRNSKEDLTYMIGDLEMSHSRGILDATIQVTEDYQVRCIGLHLKSKREVPGFDQALMRRNEAHLARVHIEAIFDEEPEANLLVFGDFNDTRREMPVRAIMGKFGTDRYLSALRLEDRYGFEWTHHWDDGDIYSRIDFILASRGIYREINRDKSFIYHFTMKDNKDAWSLASDHRPLVTGILPVDLDPR